MKTLNRILIGTVLLATLFSCQDVVTYNDGYDDGMNSFGAPDVQGIYSVSTHCMAVPFSFLSRGYRESLHQKNYYSLLLLIGNSDI